MLLEVLLVELLFFNQPHLVVNGILLMLLQVVLMSHWAHLFCYHVILHQPTLHPMWYGHVMEQYWILEIATRKYKGLAPEAGSGLIIANIAAADIGPVYRCRVTNALVFMTRDSPFSFQLSRIDRYPANLTIYDILEPVYTSETGSDVEFTCLALANDVDTLEFLFIRSDGGTIPNNVVRTSHDATTIAGRTTMSITGLTDANAGWYQCVVRNVSTDGDAITLDRRNFTIQLSVAPAITSVPGDMVFYTGDTETLECSATGFPAPLISYYFNATLITSGVSNGVLTLDNVTTANAGPYQCFADKVYTVQSTLWIVTVRNPFGPVMLAASDAYASVPENANIILTFGLIADPAPTATLQLNGGDLPTMITTSLNVVDAAACPITYRAVLTVTGFTEAHSGTYTVTVWSKGGNLTHSFQRMLEVPATVDSLTGIGDGSMCINGGQDSNLTCTYSGVPQPTVLWYMLNGDIRRNISMNNAKYVVYQMSPTDTVLTIHTASDEDNVTYGCEATNVINRSLHEARMEMKIDICGGNVDKSADKLSTERAVAISVAVTFIVTFIITALITYILTRLCCKHRDQLKGKVTVTYDNGNPSDDIIPMKANPAYATIATIEMDTNPAYATINQAYATIT